MQLSAPSPSTGDDKDRRAQCWKDVEAETGFSTYKSFLETGPQYKELRRYLYNLGREWDPHLGEVFIFDLLKDGSTSMSLKVPSDGYNPSRTSQGYHRCNVDSDDTLSTQILQHLRSPPEDVPARIVLWSIPWGIPPHSGVMDSLGLGLRIDPSFFEILFSFTTPYFGALRPYDLEFVKIGNSFATIARNYRSDADTPPVLLVAGKFGLRADPNKYPYPWYHTYTQEVQEALEHSLGESISFRRPATATDDPSPNNLVSTSANQYLKLLTEQRLKDHAFSAEYGALLLTAMLPLLNLQVLRLRVQCGTVLSKLLLVQLDIEKPKHNSHTKKQENYKSLDRQRFWLRRNVESLEESRDHFSQYVRSQDGENLLTCKIWLSQEKEIEGAIIEARAKEVEARDYMQLQIGNLSILESRKFIELSTQQMNEAKRGMYFNYKF